MLYSMIDVGFYEFVPLDSQGLRPILLRVVLELSDAPLRGSFGRPDHDLFDLIHESRLVVVGQCQIASIDHLALEDPGEVEGLEVLLELLLDLDALDGQDLLHGHVHGLGRWLVQNIFQDTVKKDGVDLVLLHLEENEVLDVVSAHVGYEVPLHVVERADD